MRLASQGLTGLLVAFVLGGALAVQGAEPRIVTGKMGMKFVLIPSGTFTMGDADGEDDEKPAHKVTVTRSFLLGIHEVTQAHYQRVMGKNPSRFKGPTLPVENVSWNDAQEFCKKLSELDPEASYRLPTEAEWEHACRAGTTSKFHWGETFDARYAWISKRPNGPTHPVGRLRPNAWGLYDMSGNVWEWCQDVYAAPYMPGHQTDPRGPSQGLTRVLRGGSWYYNEVSCRSANRRAHRPTRTDGDAGFRIVRVPKD